MKNQSSFEWLILISGIIGISVLVIAIFSNSISSEASKKQVQVNIQENLRDCLSFKAIGNGYYPPFDKSTQVYYQFRGTGLSDAIVDTSNNRIGLSYSTSTAPSVGFSGYTEKGNTAVKYNSNQFFTLTGGTSFLNILNFFTLEFWFNPSQFNSQNYLLNSPELSLYFNSSGVILTGSSTVYLPLLIQSNSWNYLAVSYNSSHASFYLNGKFQNSYGFTFTSNSSDLYIGSNPQSNGTGFNGYLDLLRISNVSRTFDSIQYANDCELSLNDDILRP